MFWVSVENTVSKCSLKTVLVHAAPKNTIIVIVRIMYSRDVFVKNESIKYRRLVPSAAQAERHSEFPLND